MATTKKVIKQPRLEMVAEQKEQENNFNEKALNHLQHLSSLPIADLRNPTSIENSCSCYLQTCSNDNAKPTISGLAMVLGISRRKLMSMMNGDIKFDYRDIVERYLSAIEVVDEMSLKEGKTPPVSSVFYFKNNYGYADEQKMNIVQSEMTNEEIEKRYRDLHEIVSEEKDDN